MTATVYWYYPTPSADEQAEVCAWLTSHDSSLIAVIAISPTLVVMESLADGWGTSEHRSAHDTLTATLAAAAASIARTAPRRRTLTRKHVPRGSNSRSSPIHGRRERSEKRATHSTIVSRSSRTSPPVRRTGEQQPAEVGCPTVGQ
jgi:hypothetical protein